MKRLALFARRLALALAAGALLAAPGRAAQPADGSLAPTNGATLSWVGTAPGGANPGPQLEDHDSFCVDGVNCEFFVLTLSGSPAEWEGKSARLVFRWSRPPIDYDIYIHKGAPDGPVVGDAATGPNNIEQEDIDPTEDGTGVFYVHVVYFAATAADQYAATATVVAEQSAITPAPIDTGTPPRYQIHTPTAAQIAAGMTKNTQDEPNIGVNWSSGAIMLQALMQTLKVTVDETGCKQTPLTTWTDVTPLTSQESFDPILFTDHQTDRTFVSHLLLLPGAGASSFTDNDGTTWWPSQGAGFGSGFDHQTVGGGPFHAPVPPSPATYKNSVYYCSQDVAIANCALSVDGGITYGPAVPIYNLLQCGGLHGHVKVGPDGTVYVPNAVCSGPINANENAVVVSEDNGTTWTVRTVPGTAGNGSDPSVAVDEAGRLYLGFSDGDKTPSVAVSDDKGKSWLHVYDVGGQAGIKAALFPAMVAGGPGRAAMAFYGSPVEGSGTDFSNPGRWYLYVAHTYDGGASWITVNATPNDPIQRGGMHNSGGGPIHRNLLDFFDADLDAQGRMVVGFADGCRGACVGAPDGARGNSYGAFGAIARQTGGRRLFADYDTSPTVPGAPRLTVDRNGSSATLVWSQSENGGSPITGYEVYRRTGADPEQLIASLNGTATRHVDAAAGATATHVYRVAAVNAVGTSCGTNAVEAAPKGSSCVAPGVRILEDPAADQVGAPLEADMDIQWVAVGEPAFPGGERKLVFTMKVASLEPVTPNRMWRIIWNYPDAPVAPHPTSASFAGRYYVGMNVDDAGNRSFSYGIVEDLSAVVLGLAPAVRLGDADPESNAAPDGTITIVVSADKVGGPRAGDLIGALVARTYPAAQDATLRSDSASDLAGFADTYMLVGNGFCAATTTCLEEDAASIAYSTGWHRVEDPDASSGAFAVNPGRKGTNSLSLPFDVPAGKTGALSYRFARSTKGGSADVYLDGAFHSTLSFAAKTGSLNDPLFGFELKIEGLGGGAHTFELRSIRNGAAYVDAVCLSSAVEGAAAPSGPGRTSAGVSRLAAAAAITRTVEALAGTRSISAVASGAVPLRLLLLDPLGATLAVADSVNGVAVLEHPVSAAGLYRVQVVNVGVNGAQAFSAATPFGSR